MTLPASRPYPQPAAFGPADQALSRLLQQLHPIPAAEPRRDLMPRLAEVASAQFGRGHACVDLTLAGNASPEEPTALMDAASRLPWAGPGGPLVLTGHHGPERLYLRRAWQAEQVIRRAMQERLLRVPQAANPDQAASLAAELAQLFPEPGVDWQKTACALAARAPLLLLTGGPGTGKTTTVGRLLALLQSRALAAGEALRIHLAAPTGKAAARMNESLAGALASLPEPFRQQLHSHPPAPAQTLHRLLRLHPDGLQRPPEPIDTDLLVVDEASMIDLETLARLFQSVPASATLVLLGDRDQLASVEAGSAWAQLCEGAEQGAYSAAARQWLGAAGVELPPAGELQEGSSSSAPSPWADATVMLRVSRRFDAASTIGQWAAAINTGNTAGNTSGLAPLLQAVPQATVVWNGLFGSAAPSGAWAEFRQRLAHLQGSPGQPGATVHPDADDPTAQALLAALGRFQVLCAVREGPWGVHHMNRRIARALGLPSEGWYTGRAVMVTRNDPALHLMNGDVGLCLWRDGAWRVAFPRTPAQPGSASGPGIHWVAASRLPEVETAFAMTIHKSQGSEFDEVLLVLPEEAGPILTRELLYTGLTRARQQVHWVLPKPDVLLEGVQRRVRRQGGLAGPEQPVWVPASAPTQQAK